MYDISPVELYLAFPSCQIEADRHIGLLPNPTCTSVPLEGSL